MELVNVKVFQNKPWGQIRSRSSDVMFNFLLVLDKIGGVEWGDRLYEQLPICVDTLASPYRDSKTRVN